MTVRDALTMTVSRLRERGNDSPEYEARLMFEGLFGLDRFRMTEERDRELCHEEEETLLSAIERRGRGEPLQYILGKWEFMGGEYLVGRGVLIPRDDTEVCVRECIEEIRGIKNPKVLELCSGSGIIAITLSELVRGCTVIAIEKESKAYEYLEKNIACHGAAGVRALQGDIFLCYDKFEDESFDALISNPPYIEREVIPTLQREVQFEPETALDGGTDGLDFYRCIAEKWAVKLRSGGTISLEIGESQAQAVTKLLRAQGFCNIRTVKDIQCLDRVIIGTKR